jgi:arsenate reductase (glutaredoxin)
MSHVAHVTIYHNPSCGTSRNVLAMLHERGIKPKVIEYLKTPLSQSELKQLLKELKMPPRDLLRAKEKIFVELDLAAPHWTDEQLVGFMAQHPVLMNRPVVVTPKGARLCRPAETVLELL